MAKNNIMKRKVGLYKLTNMAWAPDELVNCINKCSEKYEATLISPNEDTIPLKGSG